MSARALGILIGAACLFAALAYVGQRQTGQGPIAGESAGSAVLPGLAAELDDVQQITIRGAGRDVLVSLARNDAGWTVAEQDDYPAATSSVNALLIAVGEALIVEEKTANPAFHSRLGVESIDSADAAGIELELVTASDKRYALVLGDPVGGDQRYVRRPDEALSLMIDRNPDAARAAADWVDPAIIDIAGARVQRVEITHADGERVVVARATRDTPNYTLENLPEGRELQYASIANVTGNVLQSLNLEDVSATGDASAEPLVTSEFFTFDGLVVTATATDGGDGEPWLTFRARFDADQALAFASVRGEQPDADSEADLVGGADVISEADVINSRLAGWRYRIPSFKYAQLTRRQEDLLRAETDDAP